jgi:hypothetical protein
MDNATRRVARRAMRTRRHPGGDVAATDLSRPPTACRSARDRCLMRHAIAIVLALATTNVATSAAAQERTTVALESNPTFPNARVALVSATTDAKGRDYHLGDLSVTQPVIVFVGEPEHNGRLRVELSKYSPTTPERTCDTDAETPCTIQTRTDGSFTIRVKSRSEQEAPFELFVWVGEPVGSLPSLFQPPANESVRSSAPRIASPVPPPGGAEQVTGKYFAYDANTRALLLDDAVGTRLRFVLDDASVLIVGGERLRAIEYLSSHFNNLPYASAQRLRIAWKPSADAQSRVVVTIE